MFVNHYKCPACGEEWSSSWSCMCDDRCPTCDLSCSPYESDYALPYEADTEEE